MQKKKLRLKDEVDGKKLKKGLIKFQSAKDKREFIRKKEIERIKKINDKKYTRVA